ncbi:hypothetical protein A0R60_2218 [Enterobacter asburiae]|nr:hypothetical protein A0R60_2218 [Enterobacter asburiae]
MLNRLMKNSILEWEPIISKSYPAQINKYFFAVGGYFTVIISVSDYNGK